MGQAARAHLSAERQQDADADREATWDYPPAGESDIGSEEMNWQPIETAPKDGTYILIYMKSCKSMTVVHWSPVLKFWYLA